MTNLAKFLSPHNVKLDLDVSSKKRLFEHTSLIFENNCGVASSIVFDNLFAREKLSSTGLGRGVAVPHGRIKSLKTPLAAFVRLAHPIPFDSPDGNPVHLLIFLLMPDQVKQQHLETLSEIAELFSDTAMHHLLSTDPDPLSVYQLILSWQPRLQSAA